MIGKRFNAGNGMGVEVPVELRFVGNKQYLERFRSKIISGKRGKTEFKNK